MAKTNLSHRLVVGLLGFKYDTNDLAMPEVLAGDDQPPGLRAFSQGTANMSEIMRQFPDREPSSLDLIYFNIFNKPSAANQNIHYKPSAAI